MIDFIIYEDNKIMINNYIRIINSFMLNRHLEYRIIIFKKWDDDFIKYISSDNTGKKVFLLDIEMDMMNGIDIAREIRNSDDWDSQIIIMTPYKEDNYCLLTNRLLILNFIIKKNFEREMVLTLNIIYKMFFKKMVLTFKYNSEIFNIFYKDIYYIEKNINDNYSTIVTKNREYVIRSSINALMKKIDCKAVFLKTHRSCIVNLSNVLEYDIDKNVIKFDNSEINLIARNKKKEIRDLLLNKDKVF